MRGNARGYKVLVDKEVVGITLQCMSLVDFSRLVHLLVSSTAKEFHRIIIEDRISA